MVKKILSFSSIAAKLIDSICNLLHFLIKNSKFIAIIIRADL